MAEGSAAVATQCLYGQITHIWRTPRTADFHHSQTFSKERQFKVTESLLFDTGHFAVSDSHANTVGAPYSGFMACNSLLKPQYSNKCLNIL